jgi:hypothetical protein
MKSKYDYFLSIDGTEISLPVKVWKEGGRLLIKEKHFGPSITASDENSLYTKLEQALYSAIMKLHITGNLWRAFPLYYNSNQAENVQLVARDRKPWYKKLGIKCKKFFI